MSTLTMSLSFLIMSTILSFFTNSWLMVWVMLEINTLAFCSINFKKSELKTFWKKESMMKYLMIQTIASTIIILSNILKETKKSLSVIFMTFMILSLMIKMAAAPFHFWFINVSKKLNWNTLKILFTWQKLLPLYLITFQMKKMTFPFILLSLLGGSVFLINKKSFKEIMALSSVFNLSWMLLAIISSFKLLLMFSLIYWISLLSFIKEISKEKISSVNEINEKSNKISVFLKTINLAGVPPLMMFTMKWTVVMNCLKMNIYLIISSILVMSSINAYIYLRTINANLIKSSSKSQKEKSPIIKYTFLMFIAGNMLMLNLFF